MKIEYKIYEAENIFFIIDSLSNWDIHTRPQIKRLYETQFMKDGLSEIDNNILKEYIRIRKRYRWGKLDSIFCTTEIVNALKIAKNELSLKEQNILRRTIDHFYENANIMYHFYKKYLLIRKKHLENVSRKYNISNILKEIGQFYEANKLPEKVDCYLHLNTCDGKWGGRADTQKGYINIEPVYLGKDRKGYFLIDLKLILHEILHLIEAEAPAEKTNVIRSLRIKENIHNFDWNIIMEAIADTVFPGVYGVKYGLTKKSEILMFKNIKITNKRKDKRKYFYTLRRKLSANIYSLTEKQINKGMTLFSKNYLNKVIKIFQQLKRN